MGGVLDYSTTAASNTTVGGVSIAEGMAPGNVNNGMRAQMADVRKWQIDVSGATTTAGAGNTYTFASQQGVTAYATGMRFCFEADKTNTGAATFNVDGTGAKAVKKYAGAAIADVASGDIQAGGIYDVVYEAGADAFILLNASGLSGLTATVTELNYTDGVTSNIQTQLDAKQPLDADLTTIAGLTRTRGDLIVGGAAGWTDLALGASGYVLTSDGTDAVWSAAQGGLTRIDTQEPTSDVTAITFTGDVSTYKGIIVDFIGQLSDSGASVDLQIRTTAGTWRTVAASNTMSTAPGTMIARFEVLNIDNAEGSNIRRGFVISGRNSANLDRSANTATVNTTGYAGQVGYSSHTETINEVRLILTGAGTIEGTTADQRAVATLYGVK